MYSVTKRYPEITVCHRHWKAESHCRFIHGYARTVEITICAHELDKGWVMDLGNLKDVRKALEDAWDHRVLINSDDPELPRIQTMHEAGVIDLHVMDVTKGWGAALEGSCQFVMDLCEPIVRTRTGGRAWVSKVEIWEKGDNRAALVREYPENEPDGVLKHMRKMSQRIDSLLTREYPDTLRKSLERFNEGQPTAVKVVSRGEGVNDAIYRLSLGGKQLDHFLQLNAKRLVAVYYLPAGMVAEYFDYNLTGMQHAGYEVTLGESPERKGHSCIRCVANLPADWLSNPTEVSQWINDLVAMSRFMILSVSDKRGAELSEAVAA